jgi:GNAT superfamily N-acetyltransferase
MDENDFTIELATLEDVDLVLEYRKAMFRDTGDTDEAALEAMARKFRPWMLARMERGEFFTWLAKNSDQLAVACAALWVQYDWPVSPSSLTGCRVHVMNVYTLPEYRRRGLARRLMETLIGWCELQGFSIITLNASADGRHLYETLGFGTTNFLRKNLKHS